MRKFILICLLSFPILANSQALRVNVYGRSYLLKEGATSHFGFGYEQNLNDRLSVYLEVTGDLSPNAYASGEYSFTENGVHQKLHYHYSVKNAIGISYESKYFFNDNDNGAMYMSSGFAWQQYNFDSSAGINDDYGNTLDYCDNTGVKTIFPVSLRLGYRSPIDHFFVDLNTGISFIPFAPEFGCPIVDDRVDLSIFNTVCFNFNIAIGLGWAD